MNLTDHDLDRLADVAVAAAARAADLIAATRPLSVERKDSVGDAASLASQVVTEVDRGVETIIVEHLAPTMEQFELALLTEERDDDGGRLSADQFWCVDPLDGTLPFIEGVPGYAVSIALVRRDGTPLIGVVCDPVDGTLWRAVAGQGTTRNGDGWSLPNGRVGTRLSVFADRSFATHVDHDHVVESLEVVASDLGLDGVRFHEPRGAVLNACGVLEQPPACYVKLPAPAGGGSLWDFAATACLFAESGAMATDIAGRPLDLNRADSTFMHDRGVLFASSAELAGRLRELAGSIG